MTALIDPQLKRALDAHPSSRLNIFAKVQTPTHVQGSTAYATALIQRVATKTAESLPRFYYRDLDSVLQLNANPKFIHELLRQPEVVEASIVPDLGSAFMEPIKQRDVPDTAISEPTFPRRHVSNKARR